MSDTINVIEHARENEEQVLHIIDNASKFFDNNLLPRTVKKSFLDIIGAYSIMYRDFAILRRPDDYKLPSGTYRWDNETKEGKKGKN